MTIDSMQGREKEIIIFSAVRSNPMGEIGFVSIQNRINVALTRAQHCLIIIGNAKTLSKGSGDWEQMI
jgi:senataxin